MSVGNAVGAVVGAVIGFYIGGPAGALKGAQLGMTVGGIVDPPKGPSINGPRLTDLTLQSSSYNAVIPRTYGTVALTGNIIWLENNRLKEVATTSKSGGKGGGGGGSEVTTYSYYATFAVALCKGPIVAVRRIWIGPNLVYDAKTDDLSTMIASNAAASGFTLHTGSNTQLPNSRMQATIGVANTPAYRGLAYIVFKDLALKAYGNTLQGAQIKVECIGVGEKPLVTATSALPFGQVTGIAWNGSKFAAIRGQNYGDIAVSPDGITWSSRVNVAEKMWSAIASNGSGFVAVANYSGIAAYSKNGDIWTPTSIGGNQSGMWTDITWTGKYYAAIGYSNGFNDIYIGISSNGFTWSVLNNRLPQKYWGRIISGHGSLVALSLYDGVGVSSNNGESWETYPLPAISGSWIDIAFNGTVFCAISASGTGCATSSDGKIWSLQTIPDFAHTRISSSGSYFLVTSSSTEAATSSDGITWVHHTTIPNLNVSAIAWNGGWFVAVGLYSASAVRIYFNQTTSDVSLSSIVNAECLSSKLLSAGDIDVTALTQPVRGYRIGRVSSLKTALEPLQATWPFDIIQSGYKLKFKPRGSASVVTIPSSALGSRQGE